MTRDQINQMLEPYVGVYQHRDNQDYVIKFYDQVVEAEYFTKGEKGWTRCHGRPRLHRNYIGPTWVKITTNTTTDKIS